MNDGSAGAPNDPADYEEFQAWPSEVTGSLARYLLSSCPGTARRGLVLGAGTGVNDALPLARAAAPGDRILAGDLSDAFLERLRERAAAEGLGNLEARRLDVTEDLTPLGRFDLVTLFFVIHRIRPWERTVDRLCRLVAPGGSFFISEFPGPSGVIHLSNEGGGSASDPVSHLLRRYFDLLGRPFVPPIRSSSIGAVRTRLEALLEPMEHRDFVWRQTITPAGMHRRIGARAYAPFFETPPDPRLLDRLRVEFAPEWTCPVELEETIRLFRFGAPRR